MYTHKRNGEIICSDTLQLFNNQPIYSECIFRFYFIELFSILVSAESLRTPGSNRGRVNKLKPLAEVSRSLESLYPSETDARSLTRTASGKKNYERRKQGRKGIRRIAARSWRETKRTYIASERSDGRGDEGERRR